MLNMKCNQCNEPFYDDRPNFCPKCGAKAVQKTDLNTYKPNKDEDLLDVLCNEISFENDDELNEQSEIPKLEEIPKSDVILNKTSSLQRSISDKISFLEESDSTTTLNTQKKNDYEERFSKIRINPRYIGRSDLEKKLVGIAFSKLSSLSNENFNQKNKFCTFGVIANKMPVKFTKKKEPYSIWRIFDLNQTTISLFLFGEAHLKCHDELLGSLICIISPKAFSQRNNNQDNNSNSFKSFSVSQQIQIIPIGKSMDFDQCAKVYPNKDKCKNFVNRIISKYCEFHLKESYKCIKQTFKTAQNRRNVLHGGGRFNSIVFPKTDKEYKKDFPQSLHQSNKNPSVPNEDSFLKLTGSRSFNGHSQGTRQVISQIHSHFENSSSNKITPEKREFVEKMHEITNNYDVILPNQIKTINKKISNETCDSYIKLDRIRKGDFKPKLGRGYQNSDDEISLATVMISEDEEALTNKLKENPLDAIDCNNTLKFSIKNSNRSVQEKRKLPINRNDKTNKENLSNKKSRTIQQCYSSVRHSDNKSVLTSLDAKKVLELESRYKNLADDAIRQEDEERAEIFSKLESTVVQMDSVHHISVTLYTCNICNYKSEKPQSQCIDKGHKLSKIKGRKYFFECSSCHAHKESYNSIIPKDQCNYCGGINFNKASMYRSAKKLLNYKTPRDKLQICPDGVKKSAADNTTHHEIEYFK